MATTFEDRQSTYPGRYKITLEDGSSYYATLERADEAVVAGTPLNAATFNALIKELMAFSDARIVRNLLDNSNFANPVNQRGGVLYDGDYSIDRWKSSSAVEVAVEDGFISLYCSDEATQRNGFYQYFAEEKTPAPGTMLTVAYEDADGNMFVGSAAMPETGSVNIGSTTSVGIRIYGADEGARVALMIPAGDSADLKWMAVYEGEYTADTLPAYRPKDYSAELMECMRYYQVRSTGDVTAVDMRPTMRTEPTITEVDGGYAYSADL